MKNLFDKDTYTEIIQRINTLTPQSQRQWGKMNVAQMLAHCKEAFKVPLSDKKMPRMFMGLLIGWMIKPKLYNEYPWKKNLPTAPNFIIKDERGFFAGVGVPLIRKPTCAPVIAAACVSDQRRKHPK